MAAEFSNTQIDGLGDRLRRGAFSEDDVRLLNHYRRSFAGAYATVVRTIRAQLQLEPTGRSAKSTSSVIEKLRRESIRLTQVQDIAGCRLVVDDILGQDGVVSALATLFPGAAIVDRRKNPSHGYRAVHVIAHLSGKLVEIQVRSALQHLWAELSERLSDVFDPSLKYGGGPAQHRQILDQSSRQLAAAEALEAGLATPWERGRPDREVLERLAAETKQDLYSLLGEAISSLERMRSERK